MTRIRILKVLTRNPAQSVQGTWSAYRAVLQVRGRTACCPRCLLVLAMCWRQPRTTTATSSCDLLFFQLRDISASHSACNMVTALAKARSNGLPLCDKEGTPHGLPQVYPWLWPPSNPRAAVTRRNHLRLRVVLHRASCGQNSSTVGLVAAMQGQAGHLYMALNSICEVARTAACFANRGATHPMVVAGAVVDRWLMWRDRQVTAAGDGSNR